MRLRNLWKKSCGLTLQKLSEFIIYNSFYNFLAENIYFTTYIFLNIYFTWCYTTWHSESLHLNVSNNIYQKLYNAYY